MTLINYYNTLVTLFVLVAHKAITLLPGIYTQNNRNYKALRVNRSVKALFFLILSLTLCVMVGCTTTDPHLRQSAVNQKQKPVVALVLGGGGAKGYAHIGVIKTLEANHIRPDLIVGTSIGSLVGSLYASGMPADKLELLALNTKDSELTDFTMSYQGIIEGAKLRNFVNKQVHHSPIESFPIPFAAVAAEKHTYEKMVFTKGEAGLVVQASSSVPNIFIAPRIPDPNTSGEIGKKYIDGGVVSIVPVDAAIDLGADVVIAVDLQVAKNSVSTDNLHSLSSNTIWSLIELGYQKYIVNHATDINQSLESRQLDDAIYKSEIKRANVLIQPNVANISAIRTQDRQQAIAAGVIAAESKLPEIKQAIQHAHSSYAESND